MAINLSLTDLANLQNETTAINAINSNNAAIEAVVGNILARDGTAPNYMESELDMNSNAIINLPAPTSDTEPLRLIDAATLNGGGTIEVSPLPAGGTAGQVLTKNSATNYDVSWDTFSESLVTYTTYPQNYGGLGDNTTDNYLPFQNAVNALGAAGGGTLVVPSGIYLFKTQSGNSPHIKIPSNVSIVAMPDVYYMVQGGSVSGGTLAWGTALFTNAGWSTGGSNTDISIVGGRFKSTTSTHCGGFLAFKNVKRLVIRDLSLLDITSATRLQISYCMNVIINNILIDYDASDTGPWDYADGIRIESGCYDVNCSNLRIYSGDNSLAINNELSSTQDAITSITPFPYNVAGASISNVNVSNVSLVNKQNQSILVYQGPSITQGFINAINFKNIVASPHSTSWNGAFSIVNASSNAGHIFDITLDGFNFDCSNLGTSGGGTPGAIYFAETLNPDGGSYYISNGILSNVTVPYGISLTNNTTVTNVSISGCLNDSFYIGGTNCKLIGCTSINAGVCGIHLGSSSVGAQIIGNKIVNSTGPAIQEDSGADYTMAINNDVRGSTACSITNNPHSVYVNNQGFNPIGTNVITVGSSPYTYTTGITPEMVLVTGGTVSSIAQGAQGLTVTSGTFFLPPHTPLTVTYSGTPTMVKVQH